MKTTLIGTIATAGLLAGALFGTAASANAYQAAIDSCESAIGEQLGVEVAETSYRIKKVKSRARHKDFRFLVSADDQASPVQSVTVNCRANRANEVVSVEFPNGDAPNVVAAQ